MKAISLWQPWATLIAVGAKRIETRSWPTSYRGPLLIHAAVKWTPELRRLLFSEPFKSSLLAGGYLPEAASINSMFWNPRVVPLGASVAVCRLTDCRAIHENGLGSGMWLDPLPENPERQFGDYTPGRFAWLLTDVRPLEPKSMKGGRGFFEVPSPAPAPSPDSGAPTHQGGKHDAH